VGAGRKEVWPARGIAGGSDGWVREDSREPGLLAADGGGRLHRSIHHLVSRARQVEGRLLLILASGGESGGDAVGLRLSEVGDEELDWVRDYSRVSRFVG